jgi:Sulfocyanin (SoxE) domain
MATFFLLCGTACDPVTGTGPGTQPDPKTFIKVDAAMHIAVVTLIAGHPATDNQFNYDGYSSGALVLTVPTGWQVTIQCLNHGTVPNSCAIVADGKATSPMQSDWSTPSPQHGLDPGQSSGFAFTATATGSYRIASLVGGNEASGMWLDLEIKDGGLPTLIAP